MYLLASQDIIAASLTNIKANKEALQNFAHIQLLFKVLKEAVECFVSTLNAYSAYLQDKNKSQKLHHAMSVPSASSSDSSHLLHPPSNQVTRLWEVLGPMYLLL